MPSKKVFVVHGRDLLAREAVAQVLRDLGLEPVMLANTVRLGETWMDGLQAAVRDVEFAVVIFKGDDRGAFWSEPHAQTARVRQNVLFELGFMIGKLGPKKVCVLYEEGVEVPSDYAGVKFAKLGGEWDWKVHLGMALNDAGLPANVNHVIEGARRVGPRDQEFIRDQVLRTQQIVTDLKTLAGEPLQAQEVRFSGFLSAFALGHPAEMSERHDGRMLSAERQAMVDLARGGCQIFCIISMPTRLIDRSHVVYWRLTTLLDFLKSDDPALKSIYWAISPRVESYVYVIGSVSFLQGFKGDDLLMGFALTERRTSHDELNRQAAVFDERFNIHATATLSRGDVQRAGDRREDLLRATIKRIELIREHVALSDRSLNGG